MPKTTRPTTCRGNCWRNGSNATRWRYSRTSCSNTGLLTRKPQAKRARSRARKPSRRARRRSRIPFPTRRPWSRVYMQTDNGQVTYIDAISQALMSEMEADPDVFITAEDVGHFGGAFKVTKGFVGKFGPRRVVDPPMAESGFTGLAAGAALVGLRPVVEYQFADFISAAFDQIINVMARHHYRTGDPMPVTMRAPFGARLRAGPTHSQSVESYFAHVPGLKIVVPGTPEDAAGLLISSIRDNNPVLYLESKYLYRRLRTSAPLSLEPTPLGQAKVVREGSQVSVITYGAYVSECLDVAAELAKEGISAEVVDVRTLVPLDVETIVSSVRKTSRAVVVHEAARRLGYGAEIAAVIQEECFWWLDQPVRRVAALNTPTPTSPPLEDAVVPSAAQIAETVRKVATS